MVHTPRPKKAAELYNRLISLQYTDKSEINKIEWQLRKQRKTAPSDTSTGVALLRSLVMQGKADEAHTLAGDLFGYLQEMENQVYLSSIILFSRLGLFDRVLSLAPDDLNEWGEDYGALFIQCAWGAGDLQLLEHFSRHVVDEDRQNFEFIFASLRDLGLDGHFTNHQKIVNDVMGNSFTEFNAILMPSEEGSELYCSYFVDADRLERRLLEDKIDDSLIQYYSEVFSDPMAYSPLVNSVVFDITAHTIR